MIFFRIYFGSFSDDHPLYFPVMSETVLVHCCDHCLTCRLAAVEQIIKILFCPGEIPFNRLGLEELIQEGGTKRQDSVERCVKGLGGTLEAFYHAFGEADVLAIVDLPDNVSASTFSLLVTRAGGAKVKTTVLMTPEEIDQATQKTLDYRPPGQVAMPH